ncbi:hypothetical protein LSAT2_025015 [Lamellibrachia satsuma]|nr:hypothetical protein LSAT2_025015 [Lamellibrachia satsuma]
MAGCPSVTITSKQTNHLENKHSNVIQLAILPISVVSETRRGGRAGYKGTVYRSNRWVLKKTSVTSETTQA